VRPVRYCFMLKCDIPAQKGQRHINQSTTVLCIFICQHNCLSHHQGVLSMFRESFFSFLQPEDRVLGVATFCRKSVVSVPVAVEQGITGKSTAQHH